MRCGAKRELLVAVGVAVSMAVATLMLHLLSQESVMPHIAALAATAVLFEVGRRLRDDADSPFIDMYRGL